MYRLEPLMSIDNKKPRLSGVLNQAKCLIYLGYAPGEPKIPSGSLTPKE